MFAAEPPPTPWDVRFGLFGIPVRVHPMFWLIGLLLGMNSHTPVELACWLLALFTSILMHELGHAFAMRAYGYYPSILLHGFGGVTSYGPSAYGSQRTDGSSRILIAAAGPAAGFALSAALYLVLRMAGVAMEIQVGLPELVQISIGQISKSAALSEFIRQLFFVSVTWGFVNLLPVAPLDGGQISEELFTMINPRDGMRWSSMLAIVTAALVAVFAIVYGHGIYVALLFLYLAYWNYMTLTARGESGRWHD